MKATNFGHLAALAVISRNGTANKDKGRRAFARRPICTLKSEL
jgi:hypothetical protein